MTTYDGLTTTRPYSTIDDLARHEILPGSEEHLDLATAKAIADALHEQGYITLADNGEFILEIEVMRFWDIVKAYTDPVPDDE